MVVYAQKAAPIGLAAALMKCVVPFLIPDALKIALAVVITCLLYTSIITAEFSAV